MVPPKLVTPIIQETEESRYKRILWPVGSAPGLDGIYMEYHIGYNYQKEFNGSDALPPE